MSRPCLQLTVSVFAALLGSLVAVVQHQVPTNDYNLAGPSTPLPSQPVTFPSAIKRPQPHDHEHGPYVAGKYEDPFALTWSNLAANVDPNWLLGVLVVLAPEIIQMAGTFFSAVRGRMERTRDTINKLSNIAVWFFALDTAQVAIELLPSFKWSTVRGILHGIVTRMELFVYSSICGALVYTELTHPGLVWFSWRDAFCWPAIMYALFFRPWECVPLPIDPLAGLFFVIGHARPEHAAVSPPFAALVTAGWWAISTSVKLFTRRTAARQIRGASYDSSQPPRSANKPRSLLLYTQSLPDVQISRFCGQRTRDDAVFDIRQLKIPFLLLAIYLPIFLKIHDQTVPHGQSSAGLNSRQCPTADRSPFALVPFPQLW